jgi:hypothetical protein
MSREHPDLEYKIGSMVQISSINGLHPLAMFFLPEAGTPKLHMALILPIVP